MISKLQGDKDAISKDISALVSQVSIRRKELSEIERDISIAQGVLVKEKERLAPTLSVAAEQVKSAEQRVYDCEKKIEHIKKIKAEEILIMDKKLASLDEQRKSLIGKIDIRTKELEELDKKFVLLETRKKKLEDDIPSLEQVTLSKKTLVDKLVSLSKALLIQVNSLEFKEAELSRSIASMEQRQKELDVYHGQLKEKESLLNKKEETINEVAEKSVFMFEKSVQEVKLPLKDGILKS